MLAPAEKDALRKDREARLQKLRAKLFAKYDVNQNGSLDPKEKEAIMKDRAQMQKSHGKALERYDANKNGVLDPEEREKMKADREAWVSQLKTRALEQFDANKNGVLDPEEKEAMRATLRSRQAPAGGPQTNP
jgi:Ca2+-binding EF-hand superfamily protein